MVDLLVLNSRKAAFEIEHILYFLTKQATLIGGQLYCAFPLI